MLRSEVRMPESPKLDLPLPRKTLDRLQVERARAVMPRVNAWEREFPRGKAGARMPSD